MTNQEKWQLNYKLAKKYYEGHGNLLIPKNYVVKDENDNNVRLGNWIDTQRTSYKKGNLSKLQTNLLCEIKMVWNVRKNNEIASYEWMKNYNLAKKYYEGHGNLLIPHRYVVKDENGNNVRLGNWIDTQRATYKKGKLSELQMNLLVEIKMVWSVQNNNEIVSDEWMKNYNLAKKYYEEKGNLLIPQNYVVKDEKGNNVRLGNWIGTQRATYKKGNLSELQMNLLVEIKMVWSVQNNNEIVSDEWMKNYNLAKKYYEEKGNLLIPQNYVVKDENGNNVRLGNWINKQRNVYKGKSKGTLGEKHLSLLDEIDMIYNVRYYKKLNHYINENYCLYQYGLLDYRNIEELVNNKFFEYKDSEIVKGNAIVLSRKLST